MEAPDDRLWLLELTGTSRSRRGYSPLHILPLVTSPSALAAFRMEDQREISACTKVANFAGVRSAFTGIDNGRFPDAGELLPATRPEDRTLVSPGIVIETGPRPALSGVSIDR